MMHDFSLTERHVVFYDLPVTFDAAQAAAMTVPPRAAPARTAAALGVDRPGARPRSDYRARAPVQRIPTGDSPTRGIRSTPPASA